jgi:hypothetical protein
MNYSFFCIQGTSNPIWDREIVFRLKPSEHFIQVILCMLTTEKDHDGSFGSVCLRLNNNPLDWDDIKRVSVMHYLGRGLESTCGLFSYRWEYLPSPVSMPAPLVQPTSDAKNDQSSIAMNEDESSFTKQNRQSMLDQACCDKPLVPTGGRSLPIIQQLDPTGPEQPLLTTEKEKFADQPATDGEGTLDQVTDQFVITDQFNDQSVNTSSSMGNCPLLPKPSGSAAACGEQSNVVMDEQDSSKQEPMDHQSFTQSSEEQLVSKQNDNQLLLEQDQQSSTHQLHPTPNADDTLEHVTNDELVTQQTTAQAVDDGLNFQTSAQIPDQLLVSQNHSSADSRDTLAESIRRLKSNRW